MKKIIGLIMIGVLSITPAYAAVESESVLTAPGTSETTVYADINTEYTVTLPKMIKLDSTGKNSDYSVNVKGDIAGTDMINVVPDSSFAMSTDGKDSVTATVTQAKTSFNYTEVSANGGDGTTTTGSVVAAGLTAGEWNGTFNFNVEMKTKPGLYKADGSIVSWQQLLDDGTIKVQGGELTSGYTSDNTNTSASTLTGTLVIDDSVTSLGENALAKCENLTGIVIPDSVTTLGEHCLTATGITEFTIPSSVTNIASSAFDGMAHLTSLTINSSGETFNTLSSLPLKKLIFNGSYKSIGNYLSSSIKYIKLPKALESIPNFSGRSSLETVVLQSSVKNIESFAGCAALKTLDLSHTEITEIPAGCFSGCTSLTDVKLPDTLKTIGSGGFANCTAIDELAVPDTVTTIDTDAFKNVKHVTYNGSAKDTAGNNWGALALN